MLFSFEAMRPDGATVIDRLEAPGRAVAAEALREKGLIVLKLEERTERAGKSLNLNLNFGAGKLRLQDLVLLTRQMKMLLESGAPLVPALTAAEQQTQRPFVRDLLGRLRTAVEEGASLTSALEAESAHFSPVFRSMVAAGEATAALPEVFGRLGALSHKQLQTRKQVVGALLYPAILSVLMLGVICVLLFFVVPRFRVLFLNLNSPLPASTKLLFSLAEGLKGGWPFLLAGLVGTVVTACVVWRLPRCRAWLDEALLRLPLLGRVVARLTLARVLRIWAAMLRCHVPLLDTIRQSREAVTNSAFLRMLDNLEQGVAAGGRVAQAMEMARLADPIIVSAIRTGEENGRLSEATDFVSNWLDEDNAGLIQSVTRMAEPLLLAVMGVVVGIVAMALFLPLFDLATAA